MIYSTTGLVFVFFSLTFGIFCYRIFKYWRNEKDTVSKLLFLASFIFWLFIILTAARLLFFLNNVSQMRSAIYAGAFLQAIAVSVLAYFVMYVRFPRISPLWGAMPILILGLVATVLTKVSSFSPYLEKSGAVNWGLSTVFSPSLFLRAILIFIVFVPTVLIIWKQFKESGDAYTKRKTLGFVVFIIFAIIIALLDFIIINLLKQGAILRDIVFFISGIVILIIIFLLERRPRV